MKDFQQTEFVILDVETTGLSPMGGDRIIEIAALKIRDLKIAERFYSLVDPRRPLSYGAFLVNGITSDMIKGAPQAEKVLPGFFDFLGQASLVGHNVRFDLSFLSHEAMLMGTRWRHAHHLLDTVRMARWLIPELKRYRLEAVANFLEIEERQQHRAMADVELTYQVFVKMLEMAFRRDVSTLDQLAQVSGVSVHGRRLAVFERRSRGVGHVK